MSLGVSLRTRQSQVFRLGQFVSLLGLSARDLDRHLADMAQENPMLTLRPLLTAATGATDVLEMTAAAQASSLFDHVFRELSGLVAHGGALERVVTALIAELEPSGWLGCSVDEIAERVGVKSALVEMTLQLVQKRIEPAGLFARDLQECLRLQLEDRDALTDGMQRMLAHLPELERGGVAALARATGMTADQVREHIADLRRLDPKPGSAFVCDPTLGREPDVRITPNGDGWEIEFLSSLERTVEITQIPRGGNSPETSEAIAQARALKQALDIRASALRQVVRTVVARQSAYFHLGDRALQPVTLSEIARDTGFHLSTVSRVLKGLLIEGPNGIVDARTLFGGTASANTAQSKPQVKARIRELLACENPQQPISDRRLTALLQADGIAVSRRVVSNYRQEIGILAASKRRLHA